MNDLPPVGAEVDVPAAPASLPEIGAEVDAAAPPAEAPPPGPSLPEPQTFEAEGQTFSIDTGVAPPKRTSPDAERASEFLAWQAKRSDLAPAKAADVLRIAAATGHPPQYVAENYDGLAGWERQAETKTDWKEIAEKHPVLRDFLLRDPASFALAKSDTARLKGISWALTGGTRTRDLSLEEGQAAEIAALESGTWDGKAPTTGTKVVPPFWAATVGDAVDRAELAFRESNDWLAAMGSSGRKAWSSENTARIEELRRLVGQPRDHGIEEVANPALRSLARAFNFVAEMVPLVAGTVVAAAGGGAVGAAAGPLGAVAGSLAAPLAFNFGMGVGPGYAAAKEELKAAGKEGDPDAEESALGWATLGGSVNAALMTIGGGPIMAGAKGLGARAAQKVFGEAVRSGVPKILAEETVGRVVRRGALHFGKEWAEGVATMTAMTGVSAAAQEAVRSDVTGEPFRGGQVGHAMLETAKEVAGGMALLSALSFPAREFVSEIGRAKRIAESADRLGKAIEHARASTTLEHAPAEGERLVKEMAAGSEAEVVYLETAEVARLYQEKGQDPRAVLAQVLGDGGKAWDEALASGADLAVPAEKFLTQMARSEIGLELQDVSRLPQVARTPRQQRAEVARVGKKVKEQRDLAIAAGRRDPKEEVYEDFKAKALAAGRSKLEAEAIAETVSRFSVWAGAQTGRDPLDVYRNEVPLSIHGPFDAAWDRAYRAAGAEYDGTPAARAWALLREGKAGTPFLEPFARQAKEKAAAAGQGEVPAEVAKPLAKVEKEIRKLEARRIADQAKAKAKVDGVGAKGDKTPEAVKRAADAAKEAGLDASRAPSETRQVYLAEVADPFEGGTMLSLLADDHPADAKARPVRLPKWLESDAFLAEKKAWEWTWSALKDGPGAPEQVQKLVQHYAKRAFEGESVYEWPLEQAYAIARLSAGKGGRKYESLRRMLEDWMRAPEGAKAEEPIPDRAWLSIIQAAQRDTEWVATAQFLNKKRVDTLSKWITATKAELDPARPTYEDRPPAFYGRTLSAEEARKAAPAPADMVDARLAELRAQRDALAGKAKEARISSAKAAPKLDYDAVAAIVGRDVDTKFKGLTTTPGVHPDEVAKALGQPSGEALVRAMAALPEREGWVNTRAKSKAKPPERPTPEAAVEMARAAQHQGSLEQANLRGFWEGIAARAREVMAEVEARDSRSPSSHPEYQTAKADLARVEKALSVGTLAVETARLFQEERAVRAQTYTPEFRRWFGESKVVDEKGEPLVVYHGTRSSFDAFDPAHVGGSFGNDGDYGRGFYFTAEPRIASSPYADHEGGSVMPAYVSLRSPFVIDAFEDPAAQRARYLALPLSAAERARFEAEPPSTVMLQMSGSRFRNLLDEAGYDGVVLHSWKTAPGAKWGEAGPDGKMRTVRAPFQEVVAFHPEQVKSATGNRGTFDPSSKSILEQGVAATVMAKGGPRGYLETSFDPGTGVPVRGEIHLDAPDRSTLAHETMHWFADVLSKLAESDTASKELKDSWEILLREMGYSSTRERMVAGKDRRELSAKIEATKAAGEQPSPADYAALKKLIAKEERVSHAWEMFLAEGKAPSKALLPVFARFKVWLGRIYGGVAGIQQQFRDQYGEELVLSDEVRGVFRRMLAGDEAVADAAKELAAEGPKVALTPEEEAESGRLREEARTQAEMEIARLLATEDRKADRDFIAGERERVTAEVTAKLEEDRVYGALAALERGDVGGMPAKLDRESVEAILGKDGARALPVDVYAKEGEGVPPEMAASLLRFESGEEMLRALVGAEPRKQRVLRDVRERMREEFPALTDRPQLLKEAAKGALSSDPALAEGIIRARAMAREAGLEPGVTNVADLKAAAEEMVQGTKYADLRPDRFEAAMKSAARRGSELTDPQARQDAFEQYLLDRALYKAALEARSAAEKDAKATARFTKDDARAKLGKAIVKGPDGAVAQPFLEAMDSLLEAFELRASTSLKEVRSRPAQAEALKKWVEDRWADGDSVVIPESTLKALARETHWKEMTPEEIADLRQAAESIWQQADLRRKFDVGGQKVDTERVIEDLSAAAIRNGARLAGRLATNTETAREKVASVGRQLKHLVERPELLFHELDGGAADGPWKKFIWTPLSDAAYRYYDLVRKDSGRIQKLLAEMPAEDRARIKATKFKVDGHDYNGENVIAVLLNSGNESNLGKIVKGMSDPRLRLFNVEPWQGRNTLDAIVAHATKRDVEIVNEIHRSLESRWPEMEALEKEDSGIAPPKVQAKPFRFTNLEGETLTVEGGYYPVIYSTKLPVGKRQAESALTGALGLPGLFNPQYDAAATPQGHLQGRIETYARPFDLTLDALPRHLARTSKDIAFRLTAKQVYRVLTDDRVVGAVTQAIGERGYNVVLAHLKDAVNDVMLPDAGAGIALRAMNKLRGLTTESIFIGNIGQTLQNLADGVGVKAVVPVREVRDAALRLARDLEGEKAKILDLSAEMRIRADGHANSVSRMLEDTFRKSELGMKWQHAKEIGMVPFETTNAMVEYPVFLGSLEHARKGAEEGGLGLGEKESVRHAEEAVRTLFGGKRTIDLPPIMRDKVLRWFTMFHGWANAQLNLFIRAGGDASRDWTAGRRVEALKTLAGVYAMLWAKNLVSEVLVGHGPEDEDKDGKLSAYEAGKWVAWKGVMVVPGFAPFVSSAVKSYEGKTSRDVSLTPWVNFLNATVRTAKATDRVITDAMENGEVEDDRAVKAFMAWLEAGGTLSGAPVAQPMQTMRYWTDPNRNPADDPLGEQVLGTAFGPPRPGKLSAAIYGEQ